MAQITVRLVVEEDGEVVSTMRLQAKQFATGSRGYFVQGKVDAGGERLQVQAQAVVIGSKPATATATAVADRKNGPVVVVAAGKNGK